MKTDKIRQQEDLPSMRRVRELLHCVTPPAKTRPEWDTVENGLFSRFETVKKPHEEMRENFLSFLLRPAVLVPSFSAAIVLIMLSIGRISHEHAMPPMRVVAIHGKVQARTPTNAGSDVVSDIRQSGQAMPLSKNFSYTTHANSSFIFQIGKECAFELSPNSNLTIKEISSARMAFNLSCGAVLVKVGKRTSKQKFEVITPNAICRVTGTIFKVDVLQDQRSEARTILTVYEGNVVFVTADGSEKRLQPVSAGQSYSSTGAGSVTMRGVLEAETPIKAISTLELLVNAKYSTLQESGLVDVSSQPEEALIMIDDTIVGKSPLVLRKSVGGHKIKVYAQGCSPWERSFMIGKDSISFLSTSLVHLPSPGKGGHGKTTERKTIKNRSNSLLKADPESLLVAIPDYVEAMVQFTIGEYQKSLGILDSLKSRYPLDMKSRMSIMYKINSCYAKIGDFTSALANLQEKLDMTSTLSAAAEKEQLLWEIANLNANCMGDYDEAELALIDLISTNPLGNRTREAYEKLAEVRCMLNKFDSAAATYKTLIEKFSDHAAMERSLFSLASILKDNLHRFKEAAGFYTKIMDNYPRGSYYKASLFARAECLDRLGRVREANIDYQQCLSLDPRGIWSALCAQRLQGAK